MPTTATRQTRRRRLDDDVRDYLSGPEPPAEGPSVADRALAELDQLEMMSAPHLITRMDADSARTVRQETLAGRAPSWDAYPGGTRRYRWLVQQLGTGLRL